MKFTKGPKVERYAELVGAAVDEVLEVLNNYVAGPWLPAVEPWIEPTEDERMKFAKSWLMDEIEQLENLARPIVVRVVIGNDCDKTAEFSVAAEV